jgi:hypothetical protein
MDGAYHLADEFSNTFYSFLSNIFAGIIRILPLGINSNESTNTRGNPRTSTFFLQKA